MTRSRLCVFLVPVLTMLLSCYASVRRELTELRTDLNEEKAQRERLGRDVYLLSQRLTCLPATIALMKKFPDLGQARMTCRVDQNEQAGRLLEELRDVPHEVFYFERGDQENVPKARIGRLRSLVEDAPLLATTKFLILSQPCPPSRCRGVVDPYLDAENRGVQVRDDILRRKILSQSSVSNPNIVGPKTLPFCDQRMLRDWAKPDDFPSKKRGDRTTTVELGTWVFRIDCLYDEKVERATR